MAGGNLFGRALSYVVNQFLVEGLANKYACIPSPLPSR
jgi:isocitrate dehydrogenase